LPDYLMASGILIGSALKRFAPLVVVLFPNLAASDRSLFLRFERRVPERLRRNLIVALCHCRHPFCPRQLNAGLLARADPETNMLSAGSIPGVSPSSVLTDSRF